LRAASNGSRTDELARVCPSEKDRCRAQSAKGSIFSSAGAASVTAVAREVSDVLTAEGYKVLVQNYDIRLGASFVEAMHEAVKNARDLMILFTGTTSSRQAG
jgi:hypothetical protein